MSQLPGAVLECRLSALLEVLYPPQFTLRCAMDSCPASRAVFWIWKHHGDTARRRSLISPMRPCHPPPADITPYPAASPSQGATTETSRETKDR